jgi:hypothetical protein
VFEEEVLRNIFRSEKDEASEQHSEELNNSYGSSSVVIKMKYMTVRRAGYVADIGRQEMRIKFWWGKSLRKEHLKN